MLSAYFPGASAARADMWRTFSRRWRFRHPVMLVLSACGVISTGLCVQATAGQGGAPGGFIPLVSAGLWLTLMLLHVAEALARGTAGERVERPGRIRFASISLLACAFALPYSLYGVHLAGPYALATLIALLGSLIPTTLAARHPAVDLAGLRRLSRAHVATSSRCALATMGDIDVLLVNKTGVVTLGKRQAIAFMPAPGTALRDLADAALWASLGDDTEEGRSIVELARYQFDTHERALAANEATFVSFNPYTRISGIDIGGVRIRKGAVDTIEQYLDASHSYLPPLVRRMAEAVAARGSTPMIVTRNEVALGVIEFRDIIRSGLRERFAELRQMGVRTIMVTGDNPLTAEAIAAEVGVDDFIAEAHSHDELRLISEIQAENFKVALCGSSDVQVPAMLRADLALAMDTGTRAVRAAGDMIDLDSNPTKLIDVIGIGKHMLMVRGTLSTFSAALDIAKWFAIVPAVIAAAYPALNVLNVMHLATPRSAIASAVIFNALAVIGLIPLARKSAADRATDAGAALRRSRLVYGLAGIVVPFVGIKFIDMLLVLSGLA
jgi:K+-transporting ATPase ATPase B chain